MAKWHTAKVVERIDWNAHLFSLRFRCESFPTIKAGQFAKIGLKLADGKILSRPYSLVNAPNCRDLEIVAVPVKEGHLSPRLHQLNVGQTVEVMSPATGFLILDEVPAADNLIFLATGTGVGPFLSILQTNQVWQQYSKIILVYAVRYVEDFAYLTMIEHWQSKFADQFTFVPIVSRSPDPVKLKGRIPALITDGSLEQAMDITIAADTCQFMLCGNPDMIKETVELLESKGLKKHLRRSPGQITMERYW